MIVHSRTIGFLLNSLTDLEAISMRVKRIAALQQAYLNAAPKEFARWSRVGYETQGTLVLLADNGAVAARLRQSTPRVLAAIRQRWPEVTGIRIEVQVVRDRNVKHLQTGRIGATGLQQLGQLAGALPEGPLQAAVRRLIARQAGASNGENQAFQGKESQHDQDYDQGVLEDLPAETKPAPILAQEEQDERPGDDDQDQKADRA